MEQGNVSRQAAHRLLEQLVEKPFRWAVKSPDVELFVLGFGGEGDQLPPFVIHAICPVKVISGQGREVRLYQGNAEPLRFREEMAPLMELKVLRVALSDKNDLWLDLGDHWLVFITFEDGEESWRFFQPHREQSHLVAADRELTLE